MLNLLIKSLNEVKASLLSIDGRLRNVENDVSSLKGEKTAWQHIKDVALVICGVAAVIFGNSPAYPQLNAYENGAEGTSKVCPVC